MKRPLFNIGWLMSSRAINAGFSLVYLALATRTLGLEAFGQFSILVVLAQAAAGMASFSTWQAVVRWGMQQGMACSVIGFAIGLDLLSVAGGSVLAALAVWIAPSWLPLPDNLRLPAFLLCLACLLGSRSTPTGILRLHDRYGLATRAEAILPATRAAGAVVAWAVWPDIAGFIAAWALAEPACAFAYWRAALRLQPVRPADVNLTRLPAQRDGVWHFVLATNFSRTLAVTAKQVLLLVIGALGGAALVQLAEAIGRAVYPELVRTGQSADSLVRHMTWLALGTGAMAASVAAIGGKWAVAMLAGPEFLFAYGAMVILAIGGAIELTGASSEALLVAQGRAGLAFQLRAGPLAAAFLSLPMAIDWLGLEGVALCVTMASLMTMAGFLCVRSMAAQTGKERPE